MNEKLLLLYQKLYLVNEALLMLQLRENDAPTPDEQERIEDARSDLDVLKWELQALRDALENDPNIPPPPDPGAFQVVSGLLTQVESARIQGAAVSAYIALARQVIDVAYALATY